MFNLGLRDWAVPNTSPSTKTQEQFAFLSKADAEVITIRDAASDTGFMQITSIAAADNMDVIVSERCVLGL